MRFVTTVLALAIATLNAADVRAQGEHATDRLLIKVRAGSATASLPSFGRPRTESGIASLDAVLGTLGVRSVERLLPAAPGAGAALSQTLGLDRWCVVRFEEGTDLETALATLAAAGDVEIAEFDGRGAGAAVTPSDPSFSSQWHLQNTGNPGSDIHATDAWSIATGSPSVTLAILDSGGDWNHPDLASRIWANPGEIAGNSVDDDGNGYVDDIRGWDFVNNDNNPMDDHNHGTHVAGTAGAAANNGFGGVGVDWNCRLLLAKNLDASNSGLYSWWTASIYYAANKGARVLNMSEGGVSFSASMRDAVDYAHALGALVVVAMMNANSTTPYYPANYANSFAVGATNNSDWRAVPFCWGGGSSYGSHIEMCAPGNLIFSTLANNTYGYFCGTSQATPQVAAAAALLWGVRPTLTNGEVRNLLLTTADDQVGNPLEDTPGWDQYHGYGRLNLARLLESAVVAVGEAPRASGLDLRVAPNPVAAAATLRYRAPGPGRLEFEVYDLAGRRMAERSLAGAAAGDGAIELDTSGFGAGIYVVRLTARGDAGGAGVSVTRRIAVVR